jgi:hypothetical protein
MQSRVGWAYVWPALGLYRFSVGAEALHATTSILLGGNIVIHTKE